MLLSAVLACVGFYRSETLQVLQQPLSASANVELQRSPLEAQIAMRRVKEKTEVIRRLRRGELTLFEAAAWFRHINNEPPEYSNTTWQRLPGNCNNEKVCRQVLYWVTGQLVGRAPQSEINALLERLEGELQQHIVEHGSVILPGWEPGV
jgi:hypothetical protein